MGDLLKELPSFNRHNFSKYATDSATKPTNRRPVVYLPTKEDGTTEQVIVTDKANILLRYLHQQWEVKNTQSGKKRDIVSADLPETSELNPSRKAKRLDHEDYSPPD
ncbi:DET1- and DDB1-associated protein 1-like [Orbicella faveolata]|uniref:DET1- and DDB1-associated protein 1-like n=1 Tax=Orbicella faveolata TaxID=48498 RepID=UPI0009E518C0|nr:DET1- and DDB1-associated protein 1-like [Orbicella faveolata]XP_020615216.1 DET1- and DDB1-associated protein 1-like [Orbicella faveolata]